MSQQHKYNVADELRKATRFSCDPEIDAALVWIPPGEPMLAAVHDESLGGISLCLPDISQFPIGQPVNLIYAGEFCESTVRHVEALEDGTFIVGLECKPQDC